MKLSLSWLFEHINADVTKVNVPNLVDAFNKKVAEIDGWYSVSLDLDTFSSAQIQSVNKDHVTLRSPEWNQEYSLPTRSDAHVGSWYIIKKNDDEFLWATLEDFGSTKVGLFPAVTCHEKDQNGSWKQSLVSNDYILELDNKSVNHRPDLWGHRGVAREVASLLNLPFKPLSDCVVSHPIISSEKRTKKNESSGYTLSIESEACNRLAGLYFPSLQATPSDIAMAIQLARVDTRPISMIVDCTNFVMLDMSQPLHAFDASVFKDKSVAVRMARKNEKITLLDDQRIELDAHDIVVANEKQALSLAGIMGGKDSGIHGDTQSVFLESAHFDPAVIRRSAQRHKIRTDSSTRFEKGLDPDQNTLAIARFLKLLDDAKIEYTASSEIMSLGRVYEPKKIVVTKNEIERRLGITITISEIQKMLERLGFGADISGETCTVTIPSFRQKDVTINQDIIEEIGRYYGYDSIQPVFAQRSMSPFDLHVPMATRAIKRHMAYALGMKELYTYNVYDETWLRQLDYVPHGTVSLKNPVSSHLQQLVTSLIPNLLKVAHVHVHEEEAVRVFEMARIWKQENSKIDEQQSLAGLFVSQKNSIDFYDAKSELETLFDEIGLQVSWEQEDNPQDPWYMPYQTAQLIHGGVVIGRAGKADPLFLGRIDLHDAFIFELDAAFLLAYKSKLLQYVSPSKYPSVDRDISMLVPLAVTVDHVIQSLNALDNRIVAITLQDFFENPEWKDQRSLTIRLTINDATKTLETYEVDALVDRVIDQLKKMTAVIR